LSEKRVVNFQGPLFFYNQLDRKIIYIRNQIEYIKLSLVREIGSK